MHFESRYLLLPVSGIFPGTAIKRVLPSVADSELPRVCRAKAQRDAGLIMKDYKAGKRVLRKD